MPHAPWRLVISRDAYPAFSTSTSPAIEQSVVAGDVPSTVILNFFEDDGITIGVNEDPTQVLDLDFCQEKGIQVMRRVNGGGAVYGGKGSAFLVLILRQSDADLPVTAGLAFPRVLTSMAEVLERRFGIAAKYRPLNDVEVEGRKLMPTSVKIENGVMTFRLLLNISGIDTDLAGTAMPMPPEKTRDKVHKTLQSRFTYLEQEVGRAVGEDELIALSHDLMADAFGVSDLTPGELTDAERTSAQTFFKELSQDDWFYGKSLALRLGDDTLPGDRVGHGREKAPGGLIWASLVVRDGVIHHAVLNGDWHPRPIESVSWCEQGFRGVAATEAAIEAYLREFLAREDVEWAGVELSHLMTALGKALDGATSEMST